MLNLSASSGIFYTATSLSWEEGHIT